MVNQGRDVNLNRLAWLQMLPAAVGGDAGQRQLCLQEAQAVSAWSHPGVVTVYEIFREGRKEFTAMEYLDGKTLGELIGPKGLKLVEAVHGTGIVHRDLKPANVMVTGLEKLTEAGNILGTLPYMSSAQADRNPVDWRSTAAWR